MNPEDSKQEPAAPPEASKQPEPTTLQPSRSTRSVYVVHPASKPSVSKPPAAKPSVSRPSVVQPSVSKPSESKPLSAKPSGSKPSAAKPSGPKGPAPKPFAPKRPKKAETSAQAEPSKSKAPRKHAEPPELSKTAPQEEPAVHPVPRNLKEKVAIQKRAVGRAKVPGTFTDSLKHFCFSPTGLLKILRMVSRELMTCFISAVFLLIVAVLTWQEKERRPLFYIGGVFCLTAAILCLIDASLVTKKMRNNMKVILGIKVKTPSQHRDPWVPAYPTPRRERRPALGLSCKAS
uniref:CKLF like MARVEL transmembrane domain containing 1 n=1 Tax=Sciurus vulgaris TaxID=55149 RepID=A0A8D2E3Q8_SCIVU